MFHLPVTNLYKNNALLKNSKLLLSYSIIIPYFQIWEGSRAVRHCRAERYPGGERPEGGGGEEHYSSLQMVLLTGATQCGLYVDTAKCWLAASPDGLVGGEAVVEVKCPLACEATRLDWLAHHDNTFCLQPDLVTGIIQYYLLPQILDKCFQEDCG